MTFHELNSEWYVQNVPVSLEYASRYPACQEQRQSLSLFLESIALLHTSFFFFFLFTEHTQVTPGLPMLQRFS